MMQFGLSCLLLGLAVGAKLYPLALVPLFGFVGYRRLNLSCAAVGMVVLAITIGAVMWPLLGPENLGAGTLAAETDSADEEVDPFLTTAPPNHDTDRAYGLKVFLGHWKMNDFIFLILSENLTPDSMSQRRWFVVVPDAWRVTMVEGFETRFGTPAEQVPFVVTRGLTAAAFMVIAFIFARRAASAQHVDVFLEAAFLSLAWFWLLSPTLNPWYWSWALPFIPFARGRAWYAMSSLVLLYYLRFYFDSHWPNLAVWGTSYRGVAFYDFVVVWLIYAPWFLWLAGGWWLRNRPVA